MSSEDNIDLYILNEKNVWITKEFIEETLKKYDCEIEIEDMKLFKRAMVHNSYVIKDPSYWISNRSKSGNNSVEPIKDRNLAIPLQKKSYEVLEFLGDSILHPIFTTYIYDRYSKNIESEGFMTKLRTKLEKGSCLQNFARKLGLDKFVLISRYMEGKDARNTNDDIIEDVFEAFVGALYLQKRDYELCNKFVINLMESEIDFAKINGINDNYKDTIMRYFHQMGWKDPEYINSGKTGLEHEKVFLMNIIRKKSVNDRGEILASGKGTSKRNGEQDAAKNALIKLGIKLHDLDSRQDDESEEIIEDSEEVMGDSEEFVISESE